MSRAVNVSIVTVVGLILNVSGVDGDATLSLFQEPYRSYRKPHTRPGLPCQGLGDSSGQSGLTVVNVTDGTNVNMGLGTFKFSLCHFVWPPLNSFTKLVIDFLL